MTLADVDTNSMPTDEAKRATRGVLMLDFFIIQNISLMVRNIPKSYGIDLSTAFPKEYV